jgi:uncharacterized membrane protein
VGSQSLRVAELDSRREVGIIVRDSKVVSRMVRTFEADWERKKGAEDAEVTTRAVKKQLKAMVRKLSPLNPIVKEAVSEVVSKVGSDTLDSKEIKETVEIAVKEAVRERVPEMLNESQGD